jgi:hypothetical protein
MNKLKIPFIISVIINSLIILLVIYFIIFQFDILMPECSCPSVSEDTELEEIIEENREVVEEDVTIDEDIEEEVVCPSGCTHENFEYSYVMDPVYYEPNENGYTAYRICEDEISSCTVYRIETGFGREPISDQEYRVSFNEFTCPGAAAGTTFCEVTGPVLIEIYE